MAVEILVYLLENKEEFFNRGLKPACSPPTRNTALRMGEMWVDYHLIDDIEGFSFYDQSQRVGFLSGQIIRELEIFWKNKKPRDSQNNG